MSRKQKPFSCVGVTIQSLETVTKLVHMYLFIYKDNQVNANLNRYITIKAHRFAFGGGWFYLKVKYFLWCHNKVCMCKRFILPQRQEPSSCCTSSSLVWQRWHRLRLRCLEPLRDNGDDEADKDDDEEHSSCSGTWPTLARFSGEVSMSDSEEGHTQGHAYKKK